MVKLASVPLVSLNAYCFLWSSVSADITDILLLACELSIWSLPPMFMLLLYLFADDKMITYSSELESSFLKSFLMQMFSVPFFICYFLLQRHWIKTFWTRLQRLRDELQIILLPGVNSEHVTNCSAVRYCCWMGPAKSLCMRKSLSLDMSQCLVRK